jgi:hypothetical protein
MSLFVEIPKDCNLVIDGVDYSGSIVYNCRHSIDNTGGSFQVICNELSDNVSDKVLTTWKTINMTREQDLWLQICLCDKSIKELENNLIKHKATLQELEQKLI